MTPQSTLLFMLTPDHFSFLTAEPFVRRSSLKWINSSTYYQIAKHHLSLFPLFPDFIILQLVNYTYLLNNSPSSNPFILHPLYSSSESHHLFPTCISLKFVLPTSSLLPCRASTPWSHNLPLQINYLLNVYNGYTKTIRLTFALKKSTFQWRRQTMCVCVCVCVRTYMHIIY